MICTNCQNVLKDDARFCGKCGTPVAAPASDALICLVCNTPIKPGATFCGKCGTPTGGADSDMTVILPKAGAKPVAPPASPAPVAATLVPPPAADNAEDGATVILPASHPARQPAPAPARPPAPPVRTPLPESAAETVMCLDSLQHAPKKKRPDAAARMPASSLALELERQLGGAEGIERKGKTAVAAIFAALGVLVLVALGAGWYLTRSSTPPEPVATAAVSEPVSVPVAMESPPMEAVSAPAVVEALPVVEAVPAPAPAPVAASPAEVSRPASKPAARPVKKLSEEEEYLRQIRRQLEQQR